MPTSFSEKNSQGGEVFSRIFNSPIGGIALVEDEGRIIEVLLKGPCSTGSELITQKYPDAIREGTALLLEAEQEFRAYFSGHLRTFGLPLALDSFSPFSIDVLEALKTVPFGEKITYGELAVLSGHPGASRAVGSVLARNPFPIILPCHRVVAASGKLSGYSAGCGLATKQWLLDFESGTSTH